MLDYIEDFIEFCKIELRILPRIYWRFAILYGYSGEMDKKEDKYGVYYIIDIDKRLHGKSLLEVIAHELSHVYQYESNLLIDVDDNHVKWRGKIIPWADTDKLTAKEYANQPLEKHADRKARYLVNKYRKITDV